MNGTLYPLSFFEGRQINSPGIISLRVKLPIQRAKFKFLIYQGSISHVCQGKFQNTKRVATYGDLAHSNLLRQNLNLGLGCGNGTALA